MARLVSPQDVKAWLSDGNELAFLDVREHGQYGAAHPFFVVPLAFSVFERRLPDLVPKPGVRMVLVDEGDGVADAAAEHAEAMGYSDVHIVNGGAPAWAAAGYTLYAGVNVPSKTFGELLELERDTPRLAAGEVRALQQDGTNHFIVDGRTFAEFSRFSIPGGVCCPNGELALRIGDLVPDPATTIVVNCAGRTRSILGAQTLIDVGVPNPVFALENGTQGWFLAGLQLDSGASRKYPEESGRLELENRQKRARALAERAGAKHISARQTAEMLADERRTTYVLDVRTEEEFARSHIAGSRHAPGGQLVQATDQWIGVRGARTILIDDDMVRAPLAANWLSQLGHDVYIVEGGIDAAGEIVVSPSRFQAAATIPEVIAPQDALGDEVEIVDLRASMVFRSAHISGAEWSIRPRLQSAISNPTKQLVLIGSDDVVALAAKDLTKAGQSKVKRLGGEAEDWRAAGLNIVATPSQPTDEDCIDFLFFTAERHNANEAASRQYLEWEIGLVNQLDDQERDSFRIVTP
ncbi:MAG: rhodanese-like domain-containing protein [Hyphomicrobiaceae bacterium]